MRTLRSPLGALALVGILGLVLASGVGTAAGAGSGPPAGGPPGGVWTCAYIASHPSEAAAALVSCDARGPVTVPGVVPTVTTSVIAGVPCARAPASGDVSQGVFAWMSSYPYFNYFSYSPGTTGLFTYYVQTQSGQNVQSGQDTQTNSHSVNVGANYYRMGAQNNAPVYQHWTFCWSLN